MAEIRGPPLPGSSPLRVWILHCAHSATLAPSFLHVPLHIHPGLLPWTTVQMPISTLPLQLSFWSILLPSSVLCLSCNLPCHRNAAELAGPSWEERRAPPKKEGIPIPEPPSPGAENGCTCARSRTLRDILPHRPHRNLREGHCHGNHRLQELLHPWSLGKGSCHLGRGRGRRRGSPFPNPHCNMDPD